VKRLFREPGRVRLQPSNPAYEPIYANEVVIEGRVGAVIRLLR
jgi:repressor LexA